MKQKVAGTRYHVTNKLKEDIPFAFTTIAHYLPAARVT